MTQPRLITIPISHYCEKARWGLQRAEIDFVEERHLQGFHHFFTLKSGGGLTTPVLILANGRAIGKSNRILEWVDTQVDPARRLYPEDAWPQVRAIENWLGLTLGPDGRGWMYSQLLQLPDLIAKYGLDGIPDYERRLFSTVLPSFKYYLAVRMRIEKTSPELASVRGVFDDIADRLADGRQFLCGDRFTAADLTFAALSAPVILPPEYGVALPGIDELPADIQAPFHEMREHPAGQFALRIYASERQLASAGKSAGKTELHDAVAP